MIMIVCDVIIWVGTVLVAGIIIGFLLLNRYIDKVQAKPHCDNCIHCERDWFCSERQVKVDEDLICEVDERGCEDYAYRK